MGFQDLGILGFSALGFSGLGVCGSRMLRFNGSFSLREMRKVNAIEYY